MHWLQLFFASFNSQDEKQNIYPSEQPQIVSLKRQAQS